MFKETTSKFEGTNGRISKKVVLVIAVHAFIGWALCAATMGIGQATTTIENALIIHAAGAPIIFTAVSLSYFRKYNYTSPLKTALIFVAFVIFMDFFVVSMLVLKNFEMFTSLLGTWIPFALIFTSTLVTGLLVNRNSGS